MTERSWVQLLLPRNFFKDNLLLYNMFGDSALSKRHSKKVTLKSKYCFYQILSHDITLISKKEGDIVVNQFSHSACDGCTEVAILQGFLHTMAGGRLPPKKTKLG